MADRLDGSIGEAPMLSDLTISKWVRIREGLLATIDRFLEQELSFQTPDGRSVTEMVLHIAHEEAIEVGYAVTRELAAFPDAFNAREYLTSQSIVAVLAGVHEPTLACLRSATDFDLLTDIELPWGQKSRPLDMLWHVIEHEIHHRAELSLVLGMLGREGLDA
jgi:uncharacterized damage-inducible protein DinB